MTTMQVEKIITDFHKDLKSVDGRFYRLDISRLWSSDKDKLQDDLQSVFEKVLINKNNSNLYGIRSVNSHRIYHYIPSAHLYEVLPPGSPISFSINFSKFWIYISFLFRWIGRNYGAISFMTFIFLTATGLVFFVSNIIENNRVFEARMACKSIGGTVISDPKSPNVDYCYINPDLQKHLKDNVWPNAFRMEPRGSTDTFETGDRL